MFTSQVPLVKFYENLLPAARQAGYKLVLTALAREADSPGFYEDVKRYWSSIHDATGPHILFVFAGANAAKELNEHGLKDKRKSVAFVSNDVAMGGKETWKMQWHSESSRTSFRRGKPYLSRKEEVDIARDHTLEMYELRRYLRLRETQLPCFAFTLLDPSAHEERPVIVVPFSRLERSTTYMFLKFLANTLEEDFAKIERARETLYRLEQEAVRAEKPLHRIRSLRMSLEFPAFHRSELVKNMDAVKRILEITGKSNRSKEDRSECFQYLEGIKGKHTPGEHGIIPDIQRLIDWSFLPNLSYSPSNGETTFTCQSHIRHQISEIHEEERRVWLRLERALEGISASTSERNREEQYDFFIAYSSQDREIANHVFSELTKIGTVFLDSRNLRPGDHWTERIRTAQNRAKSTILIVTERTPNSWFVESEYLHAIELMRSRRHFVVPILYGDNATLPYGLEQIHAAHLHKWQDISKLSGLVKHIVEGPDVHHDSGNV